MLSASAITGQPSSAARYYAVGDYYAKGENEPSEWIGAGAEKLGLEESAQREKGGGEKSDAANKASVTREKLETILKGELPPDQKAAWKSNAKNAEKHRPGWDFTLSAPKSLSVAAILGGDDRLVDAHRQAARDAIKFLERYAVTRARVGNGEIDYRHTNNLTAAAFTEFWSRESEAQLHTHNVIANFTFDKKSGMWRALDGTALYAGKLAAGNVYQNSLAKHAIELGYEVKWDQRKGTFEIEGVPAQIIEQNSTRSKQINEYAKEHGLKGYRAMQRAKLNTRADKVHTSHEKLIEKGKASAGNDLSALEKLVDSARRKSKSKELPERAESARIRQVDRAVRFGLSNASASEAVVEESKIISDTLRIGGPDVQLADVDNSLNEKLENNKLVPASEQTGGKRLYRGRIMKSDLAAEERFARLLSVGRDTLRPILNDATAQKRVGSFRISGNEQGAKTSYPLSSEQFETARAFLTSKDRLFHIQGVGGAGKSAMVGAIKKATRFRDHVAVAKTAIAAQGLGKEAGIRHMTVDAFLAKGGSDIERGGVLYVDEATMLGTRAASRLYELAEQNHFRVAVIGDAKQLPAIEQGKPHVLSGRLGAKVSELKTSRRHKTQSVKDAVGHAREGRIAKALHAVDAIRTRHMKDLAVSVAHDWFSSGDRNRARILVLDNSTRVAISQEARTLLKEAGSIDRNGAQTQIYSARSMTNAEKKFAALYPARNAALVFYKGDKRLRLEKGARFEIKGKAGYKLILERRGKGGGPSRIEWAPGRSAVSGVSVYDIQERDISRGDQIQWKQNQPDKNGLKNGAEGEVLAVKGDIAKIRFNDGKTRDINIRENPHWDHAYALTVHKAQGATFDRAIIVAPGRAGPLLNQQNFYTAVSRARYQIDLYTDDKNNLVKALTNAPGGKTSALEGVGRIAPEKHREKTLAGETLPPSMEMGPSVAPALPPSQPPLQALAKAGRDDELERLTVSRDAEWKADREKLDKEIGKNAGTTNDRSEKSGGDRGDPDKAHRVDRIKDAPDPIREEARKQNQAAAEHRKGARGDDSALQREAHEIKDDASRDKGGLSL